MNKFIRVVIFNQIMYSMPAGDQPVDTEYTISVMTTKYLPPSMEWDLFGGCARFMLLGDQPSKHKALHDPHVTSGCGSNHIPLG